MPPQIQELVTPHGQIISVPGGVWNASARATVLFDAIAQAVGAPVRAAATGFAAVGEVLDEQIDRRP
jgi:hypothetical protein